MTKHSPIIVSGSIAIDRIMRFDSRYADHIRPEKLDSLSISILLTAMQDLDGGIGATICRSLALLGDTPTLLGSVGPDGGEFMAKLASLGVNTDYVHMSKLPTATYNGIVDRDENSVGGFYPGAMADSASLTLEPWHKQNPIVCISPHDPAAMRRQVAECKKWGLRLFYDVGWQVSNQSAEALREGLDTAEVLVLNDYEIHAMAAKTDRSVEDIKAKVPVVVTTLGKAGSVIEGATVPKPIHVKVAKPKRVVDITGAGDNHRSGFLYGLARNWPLKACAQLGAVCATYAIEQVGTQNHSYTLAEVAQRYEQNFNEPLPNEELAHA